MCFNGESLGGSLLAVNYGHAIRIENLVDAFT